MRLKPASVVLCSFLLFTSFATAEPIGNNIFTLQIGSFPDPKSAQEFATRLTRTGVQAVWRTVELPGRGVWNRVSVGVFKTFGEARSQGESLVARGLIQDFLVKRLSESEGPVGKQPVANGSGTKKVVSGRENFSKAVSFAQLDGPGSATRNPAGVDAPRLKTGHLRRESATVESPTEDRREHFGGRPEAENRPRWASERTATQTSGSEQVSRSYLPAGLLLPNAVSTERWLTRSENPAAVHASIPRPDPVRVALRIVGGKGLSGPSSRQGGLWLSGDIDEGMDRLRWIVGRENADLVGIGRDGRVELDLALLARLTRLDRGGGAAATITALNYLVSNEGVLLLVQLTQGANRYRLHLGSMAPTAGAAVKVAGSINLDNNFDSRINPYRRLQRKLDVERPPEGFEALIAMNPEARWFNLPANRFVPVGHITFHELAEAYAKVQLGLDYLVQEPHPGAHNLALEREKILKLQRPLTDLVVTAGSNRMLRLGEEMRRFYSEPRRSIAGFR